MANQPAEVQGGLSAYIPGVGQAPSDRPYDGQFAPYVVPIAAIAHDNGTGTTNATVGTTQQITHNLGVVPTFIAITPTSDGTVYIDTGVGATATTFNVKGSAASLTFDWLVV